MKKLNIKIENKTKVPTDEIINMLLEAKGVSVDLEKVSFVIDVNRGCYGSVSKYSPSKRRVLIRIHPNYPYPLTGKYSYKFQSLKYPDINNWREYFIFLAAHELRHHFQHINGKKFSEFEADCAAVSAVERYQAKQNKIAACPSIQVEND